MKEIRNGTTLFLLLVLIFAFSAQGSQYFFQLFNPNSQYSSSSSESVTPLRKNVLPQITTPRTGIIPTSDASRSPRGSIKDILNKQDQYFPGSNISIRNRFSVSGLAIVQQVIFIFLFEASVGNQTMIDEGNKTDPTTSIYYVHNATTNGIPEGQASYSTDSSHGYINTTFTIPSLTELQAMGINSNDNVTIFQYYPANNETSLISKSIYHTDTFKLSASAEFNLEEEFINPDSGTNTFRQGENAIALLNATSGDTPIENVTITSWKLYNKSTDLEITNPTSLGIQFEFRDVLSGNPQNTTDANGKLELFVNTTYPTTPEGDYYFNITANFWWTSPQFFTDNYKQGDPSTDTDFIIANFTVQNVPDIVTDALFSITNAPSTVEPPNVNKTIVTVKIQAQDGYGGSDYDLSNIPVNATLDIQESWVNITPGAGAITNGTQGWYRTDSNGEIKFNITAGFPTPYQYKTPIITVIADLQNTLAPIYPPGEPHRFLQNNTGGKIVTKTKMISIDPDFWIGEIVRYYRNTSSIRPGESAALYFEVRDSGNTNTKFAGVPVNITLEEPIAGVSLSITNDLYPGSNYYYETNGSGIIELFVYSTYLLTPEKVQTIKLNLTADFENDSNVRWIGTTNAIDLDGADTLENFNKTWLSVIRSNDLTIDPDFNNCTIVFSTTNESGDTTIRRGDDLIITYKVQDKDGVALGNVYVNASIVNPRPGVSLDIHPDHAADKDPNRFYYNTSVTGEIKFILSTDDTIPKVADINLKATADFANDSHDKWLVGSKGIRSDFRSNSSYSEVTQTITVKPQYFTGYIYVPTDNPPNELVQQNETLVIEFRLKLNYAGGNVFPDIDSLNISIQINSTTPSVWKMNVTPYQDSNDSSVTFSIKTNYSGITPEAIYNITATADFGSIKDRTYNFTLPYPSTVPTGHLYGVWVNGTDATGNYSFVTDFFEVKNIDLIRVWIPGGGIADPSHVDAGFNSTSGLYEVYRVTTDITIEGTYKDSTQDPVQNESIEILMNHSDNQAVKLADITTTNQGTFSVNVNLPSDTPLEDNIIIYGWDPTPPTPQEGREGINNIQVVTTIDLSDYDIGGFNGSSVFVGESVSISGTLTDNLRQPIDSSVSMFTDSFSELNGRLRVIGWNGTHEIGAPNIASPNANGTYDLSYQIPHDYTNDTLYIRLNITSSGLVHYRVNFTQKLVFVYWDFQIDNLQIYLPNGTISTVLDNDSVYLITGIDNRDISIRGTLKDSTGRGLDAKWINTTWNDSITLLSVDDVPAGNFSIDYSFTGFTSDTWVWQLHHILDNGTVLSNYYYIVLQWVVYDTIEPYVTITSPNTSQGVALLSQNATTTIIVTVIDPSSAVVSVGLNDSSVTIWITGFNYSINDFMDQDPIDGSIFSYDWDTSNPSDISYNITISALDLANNWNKSEIMIVIDVVKPSATIEVTEYNNGYLNVGSDGRVLISGTIKDNSSDTGLNTGINSSSARLFILNSNTASIAINNSISISENEYSYDWVIILDPDDLDLLDRDNTFEGTDEWTIRLIYSDLSGNFNQTEREVKLDNTESTLAIVDDFPEEVDEKLVINITFNDQESGIYLETLTLELLHSNGTVLDDYTIRYGDDNIIDNTDTEATIVLDTSELLDKDEYFIRLSIFDNTGNKLVLPPESFTVIHPSPPNPLGNLFVIILSPILAFGGGIGLAALYERFKGIRGS